MKNPWDNKGTDKDRISKLEAELEELKSQKENVQKVEVVDKEKKGIGWVTWLVIIIAGIFLLSELNFSEWFSAKKEYPINSSSYSDTNKEVGCESKYSKDKKKQIFETKYKNHWMKWKGDVALSDKGSASLNMDEVFVQDLSVDFKDNNVGFDLEEGQTIMVRFLMKSIGGCFLPFGGKQAEIRQKYHN